MPRFWPKSWASASDRTSLAIVVQKYGGSSVADPEKIQQVARHVAATRGSGLQVVVVVSAMGKTTENLLSLARTLASEPPRRELDMLVSTGERVIPKVTVNDASRGCADGANGWQYSADRSQIFLCGEACSTVQEQPGELEAPVPADFAKSAHGRLLFIARCADPL